MAGGQGPHTGMSLWDCISQGQGRGQRRKSRRGKTRLADDGWREGRLSRSSEGCRESANVVGYMTSLGNHGGLTLCGSVTRNCIPYAAAFSHSFQSTQVLFAPLSISPAARYPDDDFGPTSPARFTFVAQGPSTASPFNSDPGGIAGWHKGDGWGPNGRHLSKYLADVSACTQLLSSIICLVKPINPHATHHATTRHTIPALFAP